MALPLAEVIAESVEKARQLYHRLVIVVGPPRSGKTTALRALQHERGWPLVNINLALVATGPEGNQLHRDHR
ncbi:MAG: hypothetical protein JNK64_22565 [Myxococcales bacterium]|nr:hypothetical protein [Myxococcales bacterium]